MEAIYKSIKSPVGKLVMVSDGEKLTGLFFDVNWSEQKKGYSKLKEQDHPLFKKVEKQLKEYFSGKRESFDVPYSLEGTEFQRKVWQGLKKIPYGKTASYKTQAERAGSPKSVRAVGRTNGLNPLCIILPCHRVIGSNGKLTGYAGGLDKKEFLLKLEAAI